MCYEKNKIDLSHSGYTIINSLYSEIEIKTIISCIEHSDLNKSMITNSKDLFAIRQLLKNIPSLKKLLFNDNLVSLISQLSKTDLFLTKAIYFDKPTKSNWFVAYHQDLSISVKTKADVNNYKNWTHKKGQYGVQPPN